MPAGGDHSEWLQEVVERWQGPLISMAMGITGDLDRAREVTQDTFLRLCRQNRAKVERRVASWLFTVCRNRALDVIRKDRRMLADEGVYHAPDTRQESPAESLSREDSIEWVREFVQELKPRDREVVRLRFEHGMSYRAISSVMGISVGNVGFILHESLKKVRKRLVAWERVRPEREYDDRSGRSAMDRVHFE